MFITMTNVFDALRQLRKDRGMEAGRTDKNECMYIYLTRVMPV